MKTCLNEFLMSLILKILAMDMPSPYVYFVACLRLVYLPLLDALLDAEARLYSVRLTVTTDIKFPLSHTLTLHHLAQTFSIYPSGGPARKAEVAQTDCLALRGPHDEIRSRIKATGALPFCRKPQEYSQA